MKTRKVGIIGLGHVGAHVAYSLAIQGIAAELVLGDPKESKLAAEGQDLRDAILYCPHDVKINGGTYADLGDCDAIVNCIGDIDLVASGDRLDELTFTAAQVKGYIHKVMASGFNGFSFSPYSPSSSMEAGIMRCSSLKMQRTIRAAVEQMPYSVQCLPL